MAVYGNYILEKKEEDTSPTSSTMIEKIAGYLKYSLKLDLKNKMFVIKGINFEKFILRLKEMYKYKGIQNLFEKKYSMIQMMLWEKEIISKDKMKITNLTVPLFFALEMYKIFMDLGEFYKLPYYIKTAESIYNKTWISNADKLHPKQTDVKNLNRFRFQLKDYQLEFVKMYNQLKVMYDLDGHILSFEQGLGKTFTSIALAECLYKNQIIIICPNSLKENWAYEIKEYYKEYTDNEEKWKSDIYINKSTKFISKNPKFIIVNQESIESIFSVVKKNKNSIIIVDECHNFRNPDSKRSKNMFHLKDILDCKDNILMSGTPLKATPDEIVPALRMIDPYFTEEMGIIYKKSFNYSGEEIAKVVKERLTRVIYRKTKSQVLSLPMKTIKEIKFKISKPYPYYIKTLRKEIGKEFEIEYKKKLDGMKIMQKRFEELVLQYSVASKKETKDYLKYIQMIADPNAEVIEIHEKREMIYKQFLVDYVYPNIPDNTIRKELESLVSKYVYLTQSARGIAIGRILPPARNNCYIDLINENISQIKDIIDNGLKKTIIFTQFLGVAKFAEQKLKQNGIGCVKIVGGTKDRMDIIQQFKEDDTIDVLIATSQTLSTGVTLTEANQIIFFGTPYRDADFQQACDRIHRIGQTNDVTIYIALLDSPEKNITDRIQEIMVWSAASSGNIMN